VISADGETIGKYYQENRTPITYDDLPDEALEALIATEDVRYYKHSGIDIKGTLRAVVYMGKKGGASTISQQLAKQLFHGEGARNPVTRVLQKIKEWIIAVRLEKKYTKNEIIDIYYNYYDFSKKTNGIRSDSRIYFGKEHQELAVEEAAVLAGMFKNSSLYNPLRNPEGVTNRRNVVLHQMAKAGYISPEEKDSLQQLKLVINYHPESHQSGMATFLGYLSKFLKDWARENPKPDGSTYNIYRDGLKVYTTLDSRIQAHAEKAVNAHMQNLQKAFDEENKRIKTSPFRDISQEEIDKIINREIRSSDRYQRMKRRNKSEEEILKTFDEEQKMRVFAWNEEKAIDTVMTPKDSIYYYKSFLNAGMMSMVPQTGEVKAWVGGINYKHFKYDHVKQGR